MNGTEFNDILKQGYLRLKTQNVGVWKRKWVILRKGSSKGPYRLEKYIDEKSSLLNYKKRQNKFIDLSNAVTFRRVSTDVKKHAIAVCMQDGRARLLAAESDYEANEWLRVMREESNRQHLTPSASVSSMAHEATQIPLIAKDRFNVYLVPSISCTFSGECVLHVSSCDLDLYDALEAEVQRKVMSWPLVSIRRFGKDKTKFTFESGRHCETGPGLFIFNTKEADDIHRQVQVATVAIHEGQGIRRRQMQMDTSHAMLDRSHSNPINPHQICTNRSLSDPGNLPATPERAPCPLPRNQKSYPIRNIRGPLPKLPMEEPEHLTEDHLSHDDSHLSHDDSFDDDSFDNDDDDMVDLLNDGQDLEPEFRRFIKGRIGAHDRGN